MQIVDFVAIGLIVLFVIIGLASGFSGGIRFFTKGVFGLIISFVVTYFVFGCVAGLGFVQSWMNSFTDLIRGNGGSVAVFFADTIKTSYIVMAVVLFIIVSIVRFFLVKGFSKILEAPNVACKVINKIFGLIFWLAVLIVIVLLAMQIYAWIAGEEVPGFLEDSFFKLDKLYETNPLLGLIDALRGSGGEAVEDAGAVASALAVL